MRKIFEESYEEYNSLMSSIIPDFWNDFGSQTRRKQCESVIESINDRFNFEKLNVVETGASSDPGDGIFGYFLALAVSKTNGQMSTVDIDKERLNKNEKIFNDHIPTLNYNFHHGDSVNFLKGLDGNNIPNFVHLDSWDLNLKDPLPSALHGWNEFVAIESKMLSGSIIIIDDNYMKGMWVEWITPGMENERIDITYPILGKGANVYQYVLTGKSDWEVIGTHYIIPGNIKVIIQKK